jgi:glycerol-3-phosphate dehydrogenase subunit C
MEEARREGRRVLNALRPAIEKKTPIIGLEPSCLLSLRDELYCLGLGAEGRTAWQATLGRLHLCYRDGSRPWVRV